MQITLFFALSITDLRAVLGSVLTVTMLLGFVLGVIDIVANVRRIRKGEDEPESLVVTLIRLGPIIIMPTVVYRILSALDPNIHPLW